MLKPKPIGADLGGERGEGGGGGRERGGGEAKHKIVRKRL